MKFILPAFVLCCALAQADTLHGILVDASCLDRSASNLSQPAAPPSAPAAAPRQSGSVSAHGVSVDSKTFESERADIMAHQTADLRARMNDPTCAVTGGTREFALVMDNGRLVNLDEGGTTLAMEAVQTSPAGRAMLSGTGPSLKPIVTMKGSIVHDRAHVDKIVSIR